MDLARRMNWAWDQASGVAEKVLSPGRNRGSSSAGGRWSQTCSAIRNVVPSPARAIVSRYRCGLSGGQPVLAALAGEQRPAAAEGQPRAGRDRLPLAAVALLAIAVEAGSVPERTVGGLVAQLTVDDRKRGPHVRVQGRLDPEADDLQEARVDDPTSVDQRAAVGDLDLRA
jgi:hypothetical protein